MKSCSLVCFILLFLVSPVSANLLHQRAAEKLLLTDLLNIKKSRYYKDYTYSRFPNPEKRLRIGPASRRDPINAIYAGERAFLYMIEANDTLKKIARKYATTIELIKALNGIKSDRIKVGQKLWVRDQPFTLEIDKTFNRLYLKSGDAVIKEYQVSTGKSEAETPLGVFLIQSRYPYPTWFHKGVVVSGGTPENYLGSRWLGFDKPQFGIHGTIFPELIGQSVSGGCVRMKNEDVEELYEFIPTGTMVVIKEGNEFKADRKKRRSGK